MVDKPRVKTNGARRLASPTKPSRPAACSWHSCTLSMRIVALIRASPAARRYTTGPLPGAPLRPSCRVTRSERPSTSISTASDNRPAGFWPGHLIRVGEQGGGGTGGVGYVIRERDTDDRRVVRVRLNPERLGDVERAYEWHGRAVEEALEPLSESRERPSAPSSVASPTCCARARRSSRRTPNRHPGTPNRPEPVQLARSVRLAA